MKKLIAFNLMALFVVSNAFAFDAFDDFNQMKILVGNWKGFLA
ncbi:MAG: hypothetical protein ACON47_05845 [Flavobacteriaceae bacterium]